MDLSRISKENFEYFYELLEKDFPFQERKDKNNELKSFDNQHFCPNFIYNNGELIGYICYWDFDEFIFGEHFAINEPFRNKGVGTNFLKEFLAKTSKPVLIEVERPTTEIARRRINFYKRLEFVVTDYNYQQPSYHKDCKGVPMYLVSYKQKISKENYNKYLSIINKEVYENI